VISEVAKLADAHAAVRQDVLHEASEKLHRGEGHRATLTLVGIILPAKCDALAIEGEQPVITDRDAMGIASEVLQDGRGPTEGWFGIHDPVGAKQRVDELVPKPGTTYQRLPMDPSHLVEQKMKRLRTLVSDIDNVYFNIKSERHSYYQALMSLGDRRVAPAIEAAERNGGQWRRAVAEAGVDADFYIFRDRSHDAVLPWDIIDGGMTDAFFRGELEKSERAEWTLPPKRAKENARLLPVLFLICARSCTPVCVELWAPAPRSMINDGERTATGAPVARPRESAGDGCLCLKFFVG